MPLLLLSSIIPPLLGGLVFTGNLGITAWVILSNIMLYYVFLWKDAVFNKQMRWISFSYSLIIIAIPVFISLYLTPNVVPVTLIEAQAVYTGATIAVEESYYENGEWLGRTAAWVSVMILAYAGVKRKAQ